MIKFLILCVLLTLSRSGQAQLFQALPPANIASDCGCFGVLSYFGLGLPTYYSLTHITLYTKGGNGIDAKDITALSNSGFDPQLPLKIIVHGYLESQESAWMTQMKDALHSESHPDMNVVLVDWGAFAKQPEYNLAANHAIYIGRVVAQFLQSLQDNFPDFNANQVHLIGFSMGAHVVGIAGHNFPGIGRITGLDPAGPVFQCAPESERLTENDGDFVDVVHTNGGCLLFGHIGHNNRAGHQDFYVNGGESQPGCNPFIADLLISATEFFNQNNSTICHHHRAVFYFIESITTSETPYGYKCQDMETFETGACLDSSNEEVFGYNASPGLEGSFYLTTDEVSPFFQRYVKIEATAGDTVQGSLDLTVMGRFGSPREEVSMKNTVSSVQIYTGLVGLPFGAAVSELELTLTYHPAPLLFQTFTNILDSLDIVATDVNTNEQYCATHWGASQTLTSYSVNLSLGPCP